MISWCICFWLGRDCVLHSYIIKRCVFLMNTQRKQSWSKSWILKVKTYFKVKLRFTKNNVDVFWGQVYTTVCVCVFVCNELKDMQQTVIVLFIFCHWRQQWLTHRHASSLSPSLSLSASQRHMRTLTDTHKIIHQVCERSLRP